MTEPVCGCVCVPLSHCLWEFQSFTTLLLFSVFFLRLLLAQTLGSLLLTVSYHASHTQNCPRYSYAILDKPPLLSRALCGPSWPRWVVFLRSMSMALEHARAFEQDTSSQIAPHATPVCEWLLLLKSRQHIARPPHSYCANRWFAVWSKQEVVFNAGTNQNLMACVRWVFVSMKRYERCAR